MSDVDDQWRRRTLAALRDAERREEALEEIAALGASERGRRIDEAVAGALVLLLGDPGRTRQRRAADALCTWASDAPPLRAALAGALAALDPRLRWGAAYTLGHALGPPPPEIWPAVREMLASEDGDQRWAAAELTCDLARAHPHVLADVVASARPNHGPTTLRRMVLYCLRDLSDPAGFAAARDALSDSDAGVRLAALAASAHAPRSPEQTDDVAADIATLVDRDPDPGVRRAAAVTLGKLGSTRPSVRAALARAAAGADASLARAAAAARARLTVGSGEN